MDDITFLPREEVFKLKLVVNELFLSIQGESTFAGYPCAFIRLTGCNLRCRWCDTTYAFSEGKLLPIEAIINQIQKFNIPLVEVTGGEPLLQKNTLHLLRLLCDLGYQVLLETSGALSIRQVDPRVHRIVDLKCPSSGESEKNLLANLDWLREKDELKFVIGNNEDYQWAKTKLKEEKERLTKVKAITFSPVFGELEPSILSEWILADRLNVRLGLQIHKYIWHPEARGV
ncbi:radical SAM protein [Candidatus Methylacidiphilum fumarolicum]|uniref:7-carboxy-7-deazaguanine synthase n=2 Tax=Candidatus Methylacidiphilum fumarolicum TaxID=591154 RepID=I0JYJ2_METFB|nr:radical SAM protein [Candidatus Methylacidiphilum fumarolicum]MBW6415622.1 radical SAM protein [Candidatus Methylacidiphilum fumarolicum]TFE67913.1 7-carboxy-7-deazaguanine synthase [Candidatus Methylacidiphilum fumarolicum]TFE71236.1 radical SAM protein [Candidatus Methylacidiphilum fumarolicum]TFE74538.1 radical SAM protein [Candidatus Methylacidiphilum fumarolicum]TFE74716.1 7-carboxy-7-deazaguanine synthase [Candidatus Methylacidiphilum fumarolicum]